MLKYKIFYDESFHDIKLKLTGKNKVNFEVENASGNFISVTIGIPLNYYNKLSMKYTHLEENIKSYLGFQENHELKGETFNSKRFKKGFSTFGQRYCEIFKEYFELIDNPKLLINISTINKFELIFNNIFSSDFCGIFKYDVQLRYSILKFIYINKTERLDNLLFSGSSEEIVIELKNIAQNIIEERKNLSHKICEVNFAIVFLELLKNKYINFETSNEYQWDYKWSTKGMEYLLNELEVKQNDCDFIVDGKGKRIEPIIKSIKEEYKYRSVIGVDSKNEYGIRMSDILASLIGRLLRNIENETVKESRKEYRVTHFLSEEWFKLDEHSFDLYKAVANFFNKRAKIYWTTHMGIYNDSSLIFHGLLSYIGSFSKIEDYNMIGKKEHSKLFNQYMLHRLKDKVEKL